MTLTDTDRHDTADQFDAETCRRLATSQVAETLTGMADHLRNTDLAQLRGEVEGFARRHPLAFFAGAAATGFALARMAKATGRGTTTQGQ